MFSTAICIVHVGPPSAETATSNAATLVRHSNAPFHLIPKADDAVCWAAKRRDWLLCCEITPTWNQLTGCKFIRPKTYKNGYWCFCGYDKRIWNWFTECVTVQELSAKWPSHGEEAILRCCRHVLFWCMLLDIPHRSYSPDQSRWWKQTVYRHHGGHNGCVRHLPKAVYCVRVFFQTCTFQKLTSSRTCIFIRNRYKQ